MHALTDVVCSGDCTLCILQPDKMLQAGTGPNAENCLTFACEICAKQSHMTCYRQEQMQRLRSALQLHARLVPDSLT